MLSAVAALAMMSQTAQAQFVEWLDETEERIDAALDVGIDDDQEKTYAVADLDQDGDTDLICVRKQPFTTPGGRRNVLFMNVDGVMTDQTELYSPDMMDETNDRDVNIVDVNDDGWLDFVTATTKGGNVQDPPVNIRQPRVYINLGLDEGGDWLGFVFESDRVPVFSPAPGYCEIGSGDLDGVNGPDLFFVDYSGRYSNEDLNDRLLVNDGMGFFTDETSARNIWNAIPQGVTNTFGHCAEIVDMNGDGFLDIVREASQDPSNLVRIAYNDGTGNFDEVSDVIYGNASYFFVVADWNNDNLPDIYFCDDGQDRYILNQGNDSNGQATFGNEIQVTNSPNTTSFAHTSHAVDLDKDGWKDLVLSGNDVDIPGCERKFVIFQNLGNPPNITLTDPEGGASRFWLPSGPFDGMPIDINGDTYMDLFVGTCDGTKVFMNDPPTDMFFTYPNGLPEAAVPGEPTPFVFSVEGFVSDPVPNSGKLYYKINHDPWVEVSLTETAENEYTAELPACDCGAKIRFYVSVDNELGQTFTDPDTAPVGVPSVLVSFGETTLINDDFENDLGWTVENDASLTGGAWTRVNPNGTFVGGTPAQPEDDAQEGSTKCYVTGQGAPGGGASTADVDGGPTMLISPVFDLSNADGYLSFWRWMYEFPDGTDSLKTEITNDGETWVTADSVNDDTSGWEFKSFRVSDFVTPTATVQVRFALADSPANSITEGAIDAFKLVKVDCAVPCQPGDVDGDGAVDTDDIDEFVTALVEGQTAQENCPADVNGDSLIDGDDIADMINLLD